MIELIAVMLIISVVTVAIVPKIVDLEENAERKLLVAVLSEMNAREHLAFLDCKMMDGCVEYEMPLFNDLQGMSLIDDSAIKFEGGGTYEVYRNQTTYAYMWADYKSEDSTCPEGFALDKKGKCKKVKAPKPPKKKK